MKILLTGKNGQVGFELNKKLSFLGEVIALGRDDMDLANPDSIKEAVNQIKPHIIINTAAYTAVDQAESEPSLAHQINTIAPRIFAEEASKLEIPIIHFSTDYVFDGLKTAPYSEGDKVNPSSIYGKTKCEGEDMIRNHSKHIILRTSWVFGIHGNNFLKSILRLIQEKESLSIVTDQKGTPSSTSMIADVTAKIVNQIFNLKTMNNYGTYHLACEGETNWYEYANFIANEAIHLGLEIKCKPSQIFPISTDEYPTAAKRPLNSRLEMEKIKKTFMLELPYWQDEVQKVIRKLI